MFFFRRFLFPLIGLWMTGCLLSCDGLLEVPENGGTDDTQQQETDDEDEDPVLHPLAGYDLTLQEGSYWELYWEYSGSTSWWSSYDHNSSESSDGGFVRITLGPAAVVSGKTLYEVAVTGDIPGYWADNFWEYLGSDQGSLIGSLDGAALKTIINGDTGHSEHSFFRRYSVTLDISEASISAETPAAYVTTGHAAAYNSSYDDTISIPGYDPIDGDQASLAMSEYYKPGIGPVGFSYHDYLKDITGPSSWDTIISDWRFSLVYTNLEAEDGFVFPQPPWELFGAMPETKDHSDAVYAGGTIYLLGGQASYTPSRSVYKLENDGSWTAVAPIPADWSTLPGNTGACVVNQGSPGESIYFVGKFGSTNRVYRYLPSVDYWDLFAQHTSSITTYDCFMWGSILLYTVGSSGGLLEYDIYEGAFTHQGNINGDLTYLSAITNGTELVLVGQYEPFYDNYTTGMFCYTGSGWSANEWSADNLRRWEPGLAFYGGRLYVFGGGAEDAAKKVVSCLISNGNATDWQVHSPMLYGGSSLDAVVMGDEIYLFGCDDGTRVEVYHPAED